MIHIAFVDDDKNILDGIVVLLECESADWKMSSYTDPLQARHDILQQKFDIVITDVSMPGLNGIELLKQTKAALKDASPEFIVITGVEDSDLKKKALDNDATDLLSKPVQKDELVARIFNAIRIKEKNEKIKDQNKQLENQLYQAQKMELVGLMTAGIAHDFNNILAVIVSYNELLRLSDSENKKLMATTDKIQKVSDHGIKMLRQILNFVKSSDRIVEKVCLNTFIGDSINLLRASIKRTINIRYDICEEDIYIYIDRTQLFQILMNIALNAAHAIGSKNGIINILLDKITDEDGEYAILKITDDGPGMDTKFKENLLTNIHSVKQSKDGTGLGLAIVQRLINRYSGRLTINSEKGKGSEFGILLPTEKQKTKIFDTQKLLSRA